MRNKLIAKFHTLVKLLSADKIAIYESYSVESIKDMPTSDIIDCITKLDGFHRQLNPTPTAVVKVQDREAEARFRGLRSEVLALMTRSSTVVNKRTRGLGIHSDWEILNPFIKHHTGKLLYELSFDELCAFKNKLYAIRESGWSANKDKEEQTEKNKAKQIDAPVNKYRVITRHSKVPHRTAIVIDIKNILSKTKQLPS